MKNYHFSNTQTGFSLMEVLIAMLVTLIGLLGIAALQVKAQTAELESLQRAQALILLSDIVDKLNVNRETASCFEITTNSANGSPYMGVSGNASFSCTASSSTYNDLAVTTLKEIESQLQGSSATIGTATVGAMIGARACISYDDSSEINSQPGTGLYTVAVSWQGMSILSTPTNNCANNTYGDEGQRRTVAISTRIATLN